MSMHRNLDMLVSLNKVLNDLTRKGTQFNPILTVCSGNSITFHTVTIEGCSLNYKGSDDLAYMIREGRWILLGRDVQVLMQQLAYIQEDKLYFMDLKMNGWLQVFLPEMNYMLNIKLFSCSGWRLRWLSIGDKRIRSLKSILNKIR